MKTSAATHNLNNFIFGLFPRRALKASVRVMVRPGKRNLITDVPGLRVGQAANESVRSGVTVLLADVPAIAAVDVRGGAPGTRETEALDPVSLGPPVDAIVLSGGSVYGLDAAGGVTEWLAARGRGFRLLPDARPAPIVPAAILFDLANGGDKNWSEAPYRALGAKAADTAAEDFMLGNAGAGFGAMAGIYKGGIGSASAITDDDFTIGALVAVNAAGSPLIPGTDVFWAFAFEQNNEFGGRRLRGDFAVNDLPPDMKGARVRENTTIAIVATDADLTRVELLRMAIMAADGMARSLRPSHTPFDGDTVFAVSTAKRAIAEPRPRDVMRLGSIAADCLARAIARGVYEAETLGQMRCYRETFVLKPA
jgi:L-aminopeptidase/D-esterase-like protein